MMSETSNSKSKKRKSSAEKPLPIDIRFAEGLQKTLSEWASEEDEKAYRDL